MRNSWLALTFLGLISISVMTVIITYLIRKGFSTVFVLFVLVAVVTVIYGVQLLASGTKSGHVTLVYGLLLLATGILSALGNWAIYRATALAPNPGLVISVFGFQGALVAVLAVIFLKDKLNAVQIAGILLGIVAITIIGLGSRNNSAIKSPASNQAKSSDS